MYKYQFLSAFHSFLFIILLFLIQGRSIGGRGTNISSPKFKILYEYKIIKVKFSIIQLVQNLYIQPRVSKFESIQLILIFTCEVLRGEERTITLYIATNYKKIQILKFSF